MTQIITPEKYRLEVAHILPHQRNFAEATARLAAAPAEIWGRRSVFYLQGLPLLVSEIFLPSVTD